MGGRDAALEAEIASEAVRARATVAEVARRHEVHPSRTDAWRKRRVEQAGKVAQKPVEDLSAEIGQLAVERDF